MAAILPGATLGIFGGGQLGRMAAMAARTLGYSVHVLDPDSVCAARGVVDRCLSASFDDVAAAADLARGCDVLTLEIEKISLHSLEAAARHAPVRPAASVLALVQDRALQKEWLARAGFPVGPWRLAREAEGLRAAVAELSGATFVKVRTGGYDGRGQVRTHAPDEALAAWQTLKAGTMGKDTGVVVEKALDLWAEISVLVARSPRGEVVVYPPAYNHHQDRILAWSVLPGLMPPGSPATVVPRAMGIARGIAEALAIQGLLAVELFLLHDGELLVNELAPRPHNTFHATEVACLTDQFEQLVRAVCDLPLGSAEVVRPAAIVNLLGDLWLGPRPPDFEAALSLPGVRLHLYGKGPPRPGRKMGHLSAVAALGQGPEDALSRVLRAREVLLRLPPTGPPVHVGVG